MAYANCSIPELELLHFLRRQQRRLANRFQTG